MAKGDHSEKPLCRDIHNRSSDFDEISQGPLALDGRENVEIPNFCKSKIATADNIKIDKLQYTLAKYRPISTKNFYGNGYRDS